MRIKGKKFTYSIQKKRLPNGVIATIDVIEHPGAALIIPFLSQDRVDFLHQYRAVIGQYLYELPAGTLDPEENKLTCAKRELIEETGYASSQLTLLGKIFPVPGYSTEIIYIYKATNLKPAFKKGDHDEIIKPVIFTRRQVQQLFKKGKIVDGKTICALALCGWL